MSEISPYIFETEGNEITIRFQKIGEPVDPKENFKNCYVAYAYYRLKYFEADHPDKEKAVDLVKDKLRKFIEVEKNKKDKNLLNSLYNYFVALSLFTGGFIILIILLPKIEPVIDTDLSWLNTGLINTIIGTFGALTIALWIYLKQQRDRKEMLKESLKIHLDYIIYNIPRSKVISKKDEFEAYRKKLRDGEIKIKSIGELTEKDMELKLVDWVRMELVNDNLIENLITSGYFNDIYKELITLQASIKSYNERRNQLFEIGIFHSEAMSTKMYEDKQHDIILQLNNSVKDIKKTIGEIENKLN